MTNKYHAKEQKAKKVHKMYTREIPIQKQENIQENRES